MTMTSSAMLVRIYPVVDLAASHCRSLEHYPELSATRLSPFSVFPVQPFIYDTL